MNAHLTRYTHDKQWELFRQSNLYRFITGVLEEEAVFCTLNGYNTLLHTQGFDVPQLNRIGAVTSCSERGQMFLGFKDQESIEEQAKAKRFEHHPEVNNFFFALSFTTNLSQLEETINKSVDLDAFNYIDAQYLFGLYNDKCNKTFGIHGDFALGLLNQLTDDGYCIFSIDNSPIEQSFDPAEAMSFSLASARGYFKVINVVWRGQILQCCA